ncbi:MAG: shikimate kinase [Bacteroidota bacterium]
MGDLNKESITLSIPVVLIGMPGSGKTTLGQYLSQTWNLPFYDTDAVIEAREGMSVRSFFGTYGEPAFRQTETDAVKHLIEKGAAIIATGGGLPCFNANMALLLRHTYPVFLDVPLITIAHRLGPDAGLIRPLFAGKNPEEIIKALTDMHAHRLPYYQQALLSIKNPQPDEETGKLIFEEYVKYLAGQKGKILKN